MTQPHKLSLMSSYYLRKTILASSHISKNNPSQTTLLSQMDPNHVLQNLYADKNQLKYYVQELEVLTRIHQVFSIQNSTIDLAEIELKIIKIFDFPKDY